MAASHFSAHKYGTVSVDPPSIAATTKGAVNVTIAGLAVGDEIEFYPPAAMNDDLLFVGCRIASANTATLLIYNPTAGALDDGALTWEYTWWDRT
jgi:hypothetical protein